LQVQHKMATIIQCNNRELRANCDEVEVLISAYDHVALCLQELQVSDSYNRNNTLYTMIAKVYHTRLLVIDHMLVQVFSSKINLIV